MIATVHLADLGAGSTLRTLTRRPTPKHIAGLRWADVAVLAPLATTRPPRLGRAALLAFWDSEAAADEFSETSPLGRRFSSGFRATLQPLRAYGSWPGLPDDLPHTRAVPHDGPVVVLTLGRLRLSQIVRFFRTSRPAEKAATEAAGMLWATAAARPPFVATISMWKDIQATAAYAYTQQSAHNNAITAQQRKDFHRQSAFVRFAPIHVDGMLDGPSPLSAATIAG